jgi:hypothetical protein
MFRTKKRKTNVAVLRLLVFFFSGCTDCSNAGRSNPEISDGVLFYLQLFDLRQLLMPLLDRM